MWNEGDIRRRVLVECDYSGFHAIMLGREAQSARYILLAQNDIHSWLTSHIIGKPVSIPDISNVEAISNFKRTLKIIKAENKVIRDTQAKPTILGVGLGLGARKMYWMNREKWDKKLAMMVGIKSEAHSKTLQDLIKQLLPEVFLYQERIKELAFRQTYLINKWGMIRWFFDVRGEDGEAAIAFNVQGNAHGMLRWVMRRLDEDIIYKREMDTTYFDLVTPSLDSSRDNWSRVSSIDEIEEWLRLGRPRIHNNYIIESAMERFHFINTIHDSLIFEPWLDEREECIKIVTEVMETPCKVLADPLVCPEGLIVRTETTTGFNWADQSESNPEGMRIWIN